MDAQAGTHQTLYLGIFFWRFSESSPPPLFITPHFHRACTGREYERYRSQSAAGGRARNTWVWI